VTPAAPPFLKIEPPVGRQSAYVVFPEAVFLVMRDLYMGSRDRGGERDRTLKRLTRSWGRDGYRVRVSWRTAETVGRFLSTVVWEVGYRSRSLAPFIEERHRQVFERELKKARDWLDRFAHHRLDVVDKLASLAEPDAPPSK